MIKIFNCYFHKRTFFHIILDLGLVSFTVVVAILYQVAGVGNQPVVSILWTTAVLFAVAILMINSSLGLYDRVHSRTVSQTSARGALVLFLALPLSYAIFHLSPVKLQNGKVFMLVLLGGLIIMLMHRIYATHIGPRALIRQRVLIYGSGKGARLVGQTLKKSDPNVDLVGYYASPNEVVTEVSGWAVLPRDKSLTDVVQQARVDEIVVALTERRGGSMPMRELLDCKLQGVRVVDTATYFEMTLGQIRLDSVSAGWLIFGEGFDQGVMRTITKRLFDIVCASVLTMVAAPILLVAAVLIKLESAGPILYRQERVGLNGRLFSVVKLRSMRTDAEKDGQPVWASATDSRVTRVGRWLRRVRIDELPQLFNVLRGDMSLVGPRPERPFFVDKLTQEIPYFAVRQSVKPGVTGWAQVRYHYGASVEDAVEKLQYDLYYVKNHSLFLDLVVLFETVGVVLMGKGAQ
ncbi:exopolysaccharide biosynthesis polyprenyl glycosylphosphotransferase [Polaromonas sp. C04]|nr:TIGR03013 family XrtA/PEP-CTERM system glycosyltransferase [Polaromonas sp. C04]OOG51216.1 exopolysaccharide biosynthesis polyprenyl glycosylphosphotransferase [Polaromonas sp. C04]